MGERVVRMGMDDRVVRMPDWIMLTRLRRRQSTGWSNIEATKQTKMKNARRRDDAPLKRADVFHLIDTSCAQAMRRASGFAPPLLRLLEGHFPVM
jgi:hypothetical protein